MGEAKGVTGSDVTRLGKTFLDLAMEAHQLASEKVGEFEGEDYERAYEAILVRLMKDEGCEIVVADDENEH
jgi:hypothetical protein